MCCDLHDSAAILQLYVCNRRTVGVESLETILFEKILSFPAICYCVRSNWTVYMLARFGTGPEI